MKILSIDIGLINLALVYIEYDNEKISEIAHKIQPKVNKTLNILEYHLVDITKYSQCTNISCNLDHRKCISNYMKHLFVEYARIFEEATVILVERQPPVGFVSVEQIICYQYPDKYVMISPRSVHAFFQFSGLDYENRKKTSVKIAKSYYLEDFDELVRKHDVSDAIVQAVYYVKKLLKDELPTVRPTTNKFTSEDIYNYVYCEE